MFTQSGRRASPLPKFRNMADTPYTRFVVKEAEQGGVQMKGSVGTATGIYHTRLPQQRGLQRMAKCRDLSKKAKNRLSMIGHYKKGGNASVTCRRYGISRTTLYQWLRRYLEKGPRSLEDLPRTPKGEGPPGSPGRRSSSAAT